ncbi:hypothetical protein CVT26_010488 [Gymnopilus dilepis]|uniref:Uncharacterized protein n=1 Tax=Gymnopilus dilepis TaxID=231916 RepID=A0A409Y0E0_9AGAR|nr:hypothetical protein CVT26_010488 [Gymnopilus dilepis]
MPCKDEFGSMQVRPAQERVKRRQFSASPAPMTPTKLRSRIKKTEKGQHLAKATEHREAFHKQLSSTLEVGRCPSPQPSREQRPVEPDIAPAPPSAPPFPEQTVARPAVQQREGHTKLEQSSGLPPGVIIHPKYGLVWLGTGPTSPLPQETCPAHSRAASLISDVQREHIRDDRSKAPEYAAPAGSERATPFGDRSRSSSRQPSVARDRDKPILTHDNVRQASLRPTSDVSVVPTTQRGTASRETPMRRVLSPPSDSEDDEQSTPHADASIESLSSVASNVPDELLDALSTQLREISASTGIPQGDIIRQLDVPHVQVLDFFDMYRDFFATRVEEELRRLPHLDLPDEDAEIPDHLIEQIFKQFMKETPHYKSSLMDRWSIMRIARTSGDRQEHFTSFATKLEGIFRSASDLLQFESATCVVGSDVHRDQELSTTICSPMVSEFFPDRLGISQREITGHLKAHAYDCVSRRFPPKVQTQDPAVVDSSGNGSKQVVDEVKMDARTRGGSEPLQNAVDCPSTSSSTKTTRIVDVQSTDVKKESKAKDGALLRELKERLLELTKPCGIKQLQSRTQLTRLPKMLAMNGWILENWPEDVPFACDCRTGKGVAGLSVDEQVAFLRALKDPNFPLRVVKKSEDALPDSEPVIIGVPPPPGSRFTHGRRRFLDREGTEDRKGPQRLASLGLSLELAESLEVSEQSTTGHPYQSNSLKRSLSRDNFAGDVTSKRVRIERRDVPKAASPSENDSLGNNKADYAPRQRGIVNDHAKPFVASQSGGRGEASRSLMHLPLEHHRHPSVVEPDTHGSSRSSLPRAEGQLVVPTVSINDDEQLPSRPHAMSGDAFARRGFPYQHGGSYVFGPTATSSSGEAGPGYLHCPPKSLPFNPFRGSRQSTPQPPGSSYLQVPSVYDPSNSPRQPQSPRNATGSYTSNDQIGGHYAAGSMASAMGEIPR